MSDDRDTPAVLPYRVGQIEERIASFEKSQAEGFARLETKIDNYASTFVTQPQMIVAQQRADEIHGQIRNECSRQNKSLTSEIQELKDWNTWAARIVLGGVIVGILATVGVKAI